MEECDLTAITVAPLNTNLPTGIVQVQKSCEYKVPSYFGRNQTDYHIFSCYIPQYELKDPQHLAMLRV
jgi:hypothetical protein